LIGSILIDDVFVGRRRRKDLGNIEELANDLKENGQITAITVRPPNALDIVENDYTGQPWVLVAGERRITAAIRNGWKTIRAMDREQLDPITHRRLELQENLARKEMTFLEVVQAKQEIMDLMRSVNPNITQAEVAREIGETPANFSRDIAVAEAIEKRPELANASSKKAILRHAKMADHFEARVMRDNPNLGLDLGQRLVTADMQDWLRTVETGSVDLSFPDFPYGINFYKQGNKMRAAADAPAGISEYDDTEEVSQDLFIDAVPQLIRVTKEGGWIACFMSEANYPFLKSLFESTCCTHFDYKAEDEEGQELNHCLFADTEPDERDNCRFRKVEEPRWIWYRPNSQNNPRYPEIHAKNVYEHILVFNRGSGKLMRPCDNLLVYDAEYGNRIHAMQKPLDLCKDIISRLTLPGERVIDPCFGSGAHLAAAAELLRDFYGCEKNPALRDQALGYVSQHYSGVAPRVTRAGGNHGESDAGAVTIDQELTKEDS
jgi:ParB/RepB/Spo0J family partition protein